MTGSFKVSAMRPIREGMTISRGAGVRGVTWFSLGAGTDISRESYDVPTLYLCAEGRGEFLLGEDAENVAASARRAAHCSRKNALRRQQPGGRYLYRNHC